MLARFLQSLHDSGRAELACNNPGPAEAMAFAAGTDPEELRKIRKILKDWHAEAVMDLPGPPLEFHPEAAVWGAVLLFRAACLVCFREIGESGIRVLLENQKMPDAGSPAAHFSADLCLRHWPELCRMARARSEDDPLVRVMHALAAGFPLSSLGMNLEIPPSGPLLDHPGLHQFFAERALERSDHANLAVPEIDALVRSRLGSHLATLGRGLLHFPSPS